MAEKVKVFKCERCGNVYEKTYAAGGCTPACCGQPCKEAVVQTSNPDDQKHVPWIEKQKDGFLIKIGKNAAHPMEPDHYIVYIEICADGVLMRKYLEPGDKPEAFFHTHAEKVTAWEYCNKHELWKSG